jgi:hypothetical protein
MNQGAFSVLAEPRGSKHRLDAWNMIDLRVEKTFQVNRFSLRLAADIFNLFNEDTMINTLSTIVTAEGFMNPSAIANPRQVQLGFRLTF